MVRKIINDDVEAAAMKSRALFQISGKFNFRLFKSILKRLWAVL